MPRIEPVNLQTADQPTVTLLEGVKSQLGMVPNLIATMAHSRATAQAYLGFSSALAGGSLTPRLREQIALVVGQANTCEYCLSAHSALGRKAGLSADEVLEARRGQAADPKTQAALDFARQLVVDRGWVPDESVSGLRDVGFSDGEITEIIGHVALNIFTNYFNHVADTDIDFPAVTALNAA